MILDFKVGDSAWMQLFSYWQEYLTFNIYSLWTAFPACLIRSNSPTVKMFSVITNSSSSGPIFLSIRSSESHHLERVQEPGELVEPLWTIVGHSIVNEAIEFVDVGETQLVKVLLTLQALDWNWWKQKRTVLATRSAVTFLTLFYLLHVHIWDEVKRS